MNAQELRDKLIRGIGKRRSSSVLERWLRRRLPLLEYLEDRVAPAVLQTDIPLVLGTNYQSARYTAALVAANHFEDISTNPAAKVILADTDNTFLETDIGFNFNFYGNTFSKIFVTSNGLLSFKSQASDIGYPDNFNTDLTANVGPNRALIAALWDDWLTNVSSADQVYIATLGTPGNRRFVVQWDQLTGYASAPTTVTFEAALFESDGRIELRYKDVTAGDGFQQYFRDNGKDATIGIRSDFAGAPAGVLYAAGSGPLLDTVDGIQIGFNGGPKNDPVVDNGMTIAFVPGRVALADLPPDVRITGVPETTREGTKLSLGSVVSDPDQTGGPGATFTYSWSVTKDGAAVTAGINTPTDGPTFSFTPPDNGRYVVNLTVVDQDGATTTTSRIVNVSNVSPVLDAGTNSTVASSGSPFTRTLKFTDPGADSWKIDVDWGDGVKQSFPLTPGSHAFDAAAQTFQLSYIYHTDTTYKIKVTITDKDGGTDTEVFPVAVFDPNEFARIVAFAISETGEDGIGNVDLPTAAIHLAATLASGEEGDNIAVTLFNSDPTNDNAAPGTIPVTVSGTTSSVRPLFFLDTRAITQQDATVDQVYEFTVPDALATNNIKLFWFNKVTNRWVLVSDDPANGDKIEITPILNADGSRSGNSLVRITKHFGPGSSPATDQLGGTVFSIAVPVGGSGNNTTFVILPTSVVSNGNTLGAAVVVETTDLGSRSNFALSLQESQTPLPAAGAVTDGDASVDQILNWLLNGDLRGRPHEPESAPAPATTGDEPQTQPPTVPRPPSGGGGDDAVDLRALADAFASELELDLPISSAPLPVSPPILDESRVETDRSKREVDPRRIHAGVMLASLLAGAAGMPRRRNATRYKPTLQTSQAS